MNRDRRADLPRRASAYVARGISGDSESQDLRRIRDVALDQAVAQLRVDGAAVLHCDPTPQTLTCAAGQRFRTNAMDHAQAYPL